MSFNLFQLVIRDDWILYREVSLTGTWPATWWPSHHLSIAARRRWKWSANKYGHDVPHLDTCNTNGNGWMDCDRIPVPVQRIIRSRSAENGQPTHHDEMMMILWRSARKWIEPQHPTEEQREKKSKRYHQSSLLFRTRPSFVFVVLARRNFYGLVLSQSNSLPAAAAARIRCCFIMSQSSWHTSCEQALIQPPFTDLQRPAQ